MRKEQNEMMEANSGHTAALLEASAASSLASTQTLVTKVFDCLTIGMIVFKIPQTELAMRGSNGVGLEGAMKSLRERSRIPSPIFAVIYGTW